MTLATFVLFTLGMLSEMIFLIDAAHPLQRYWPGPPTTVWERVFNPPRLLVAILAVLAGLFLGAFYLFGVQETRVYIDTPLVSPIMMVIAVFTFFAALFSDLFIPRVNEQTILVVQGLVLANALGGGRPVDWMPLAALIGVPAAVSLGLLVWGRPLPPALKAVLYLWYLVSLLALPFQSGETLYFRLIDFNWLEGVLFGMLFFFLVSHFLFTLRFFLIVVSLVVPRNRHLAAQFMPRLFFDQQVAPLRFLGVAGLIALLLAANAWLGWIARPLALGLAAALGVQLLNWPQPRGQNEVY